MTRILERRLRRLEQARGAQDDDELVEVGLSDEGKTMLRETLTSFGKTPEEIEATVNKRQHRPVRITLPPLERVEDASAATAALVQAVAAGDLTPSEGEALAKLIETHHRAVELVDLETRLTRLEQQEGVRP